MRKHEDFRVKDKNYINENIFNPSYEINSHYPHYINDGSQNTNKDQNSSDSNGNQNRNGDSLLANNSSNDQDNSAFPMSSRAPSYKQSLFHPMNVSFNSTDNNQNSSLFLSKLVNESENKVKWKRNIRKREAVSERLVEISKLEEIRSSSPSSAPSHTRPSLVAAHIAPRKPQPTSNSQKGIAKNFSSTTTRIDTTETAQAFRLVYFNYLIPTYFY